MGALIPRHGGYRKLKSFQVARLVYDVTVRFCDRYVDRFSRTRDQMVQAARSGVQNIAEGSQASATSKKTELKLTEVARASLEELKLDYEDFLRQRARTPWPRNDPRRQQLIDLRPSTAEDVAVWVKGIQKRPPSGSSTLSPPLWIVHPVHPVHPVHSSPSPHLPRNLRQRSPNPHPRRLRPTGPTGRATGRRLRTARRLYRTPLPHTNGL
jgi:four helix bundle protein